MSMSLSSTKQRKQNNCVYVWKKSYCFQLICFIVPESPLWAEKKILSNEN